MLCPALSGGVTDLKTHSTMLQQIRDRITGKFALVILVVLALSFVFFGVSGSFIGLGYAAKVNGQEIPIASFENAYRNRLLQLAEQGSEIPTELRPLLRDGVLDGQIRDLLVEQYIDDARYEVADRLVTDVIQRNPTWQVDGEFSRDEYYQWLDQQAVTPSQFEMNQRLGMEINQLQRGVAATAFVTPSEYRRYLNLYGEQRQVSVAEVDVAALTESIEVSEADIQAYYDERPEGFMSPESVDLRYLELSRSALAGEVDVTEQELKDYYDDSSSLYLQEEQRQARHILIPFGDDEAAAEQEAAGLTARAGAGEPFEDLARQYSKDTGTAERGGDLGLLLRAQLPAELGDAVFAMDVGDVDGPVRTSFGFHVVKLDEARAGGVLPLDEVRNEVLSALQIEKADAAYSRMERSLSAALFDAEDIQSLSETVGLELRSADGFQRTGGEPFAANQAIIDTVFADRVLNDREISDIVELDADRSVVVAVESYQEAARRPLAEVSDQILSAVKSERAFAIANERVATLEAALAGGQDFEEAAALVEGTETRTIAVTRQSTDGDSRVRASVFQEKKPVAGQPRVGTVLMENGNYAVYSVTAYSPGRPESIPLAERDEMKIQLGADSGSKDYLALIMNLENEAEIIKSEDVLAADSLFE